MFFFPSSCLDIKWHTDKLSFVNFGFLSGLCVLCLAQYSEKLGVPFFGQDICHEGSLGAMGHLRVGVQPVCFLSCLLFH